MWQGLLETTERFLTLLCCIIVLAANCLSACSEYKLKIINNPAYAIGKVDVYSPGGKLASQIQFQYSVNGNAFHQQYENAEYGWFVPAACGNCSSGNKFIVQYDSLNPPTGRMLFNYPIADSVDYKKDLSLLWKSPPRY
jgi:hypothetical protein